MTICEQITERFPIRKTAAQKKAFRQWVMAEIAQMGYPARVEQNDRGRQQNVIVGDKTPDMHVRKWLMDTEPSEAEYSCLLFFHSRSHLCQG